MSKKNLLLIIGIIILYVIYYQYGTLITNYLFILKEGLTSCPAGCVAPTELTANCKGSLFDSGNGTYYKNCPYQCDNQCTDRFEGDSFQQNRSMYKKIKNILDCTGCGVKKVFSSNVSEKAQSKPVKDLVNSNYGSQIWNKESDTLNISNTILSQQSQQLQDFQRSQQSQQSQQSQLRDDLSRLIPSKNISTVTNSSIKSQNLNNNMTDIKTWNCKCYT
uniref:Uncharacterized protein n=1 Tax=viral metagenome TaxID=1070528 RepID=A0A6C0AXY9_9ZZZZ|tara:strand:+ start:187 stop:843 length:657 start_codon:yes stop_codon:yes gene_type:complete